MAGVSQEMLDRKISALVDLVGRYMKVRKESPDRLPKMESKIQKQSRDLTKYLVKYDENKTEERRLILANKDLLRELEDTKMEVEELRKRLEGEGEAI